MSREKGGMRSPSLLCALPKGKGVPKGKGDVRGVGGSNRKQIKQLDHSLNEKKKSIAPIVVASGYFFFFLFPETAAILRSGVVDRMHCFASILRYPACFLNQRLSAAWMVVPRSVGSSLVMVSFSQ